MIGKKGLGVSQVFVFIIAAITFIMIMLFGYKAISDIGNQAGQIEFIEFKTSLESSVKKIYTEFGAVRNEEFFPPSDYTQICFVDMDYQVTDDEISALCKKDSIACDIWRDANNAIKEGKSGYDSVESNVFTRPIAPVPLKVYKIETAYYDELSDNYNKQGFVCIDIRSGRFSIMLEGKGDHTIISVPKQN